MSDPQHDPLHDDPLHRDPLAGDEPGQPTRKQQLKPFEYLAFAGVAGLFAGLIVLLTVRDVVLALVFGGVGFILTLLITATLMLAIKPKGRAAADLDKRDGFGS